MEPRLPKTPKGPQLVSTVSLGITLTRRKHLAAVAALAFLHATCGAYLIGLGRVYMLLEDPYMDYLVSLLASEDNRRFYLWGSFYYLGLLGIEGRHFSTLFLAREVIEVASQCFQLYHFSSLIGRPWINDLYVAVVVANCWITPVLQTLFKIQPGPQRIASLAADALLSCITCMCIPLIIFVPTAQLFGEDVYAFPIEVLYDDSLFNRLVMENQSVFAISTADGISKLVPHMSIFMSLRTIRTMLRQEESTGPKRTVVPVAAGPHHIPSLTLTAAVPPGPKSIVDPVPTSPAAKQVEQADDNSWTSIRHRLVHVALVAVGLVVIVLHVRAIFRDKAATTTHGCKQRLRPWFATKSACAVYEFSCYRENVTTPDPASAFAELDEQTLVALIISHCPELVVPPTIRQFPNLRSIELWNATLIDWGHEAALSAEIHTSISYLALIYVNMTELPIGILESLPPMLTDIEISVTNLTSLPANLHELWLDVSVLYFEHAQFTDIPATLLAMPVADLSLIGNRIEGLEENTLRQNWVVFSLSSNPLRALPSVVDPAMSIAYFLIEDTGLEEFPPWVSEQIGFLVAAYGTPMCERNASDVAVDALVSCEPIERTREGRYPLWLMETLRKP